MEINEKYSPRIRAYCLSNGKQSSLKIQKRVFENNLFNGGDILYVKNFKEKPAVKFENGKFTEIPDEKCWWIENYEIISPEEFDKRIRHGR
jgi:glutamine cyclotransferase